MISKRRCHSYSRSVASAPGVSLYANGVLRSQWGISDTCRSGAPLPLRLASNSRRRDDLAVCEEDGSSAWQRVEGPACDGCASSVCRCDEDPPCKRSPSSVRRRVEGPATGPCPKSDGDRYCTTMHKSHTCALFRLILSPLTLGASVQRAFRHRWRWHCTRPALHLV